MEHHGSSSWIIIEMGWVYEQLESAVHVRPQYWCGGVVPRRRDPGDSRVAGLAYIHTYIPYHTHIRYIHDTSYMCQKGWLSLFIHV